MAADGYQTKYRAEVIRGPLPFQGQVQHQAKISDTVQFAMKKGYIMSLDANGEFVPGIPAAAGEANEAYMLWGYHGDSDTVTDMKQSGNWQTDDFAYQPMPSRGWVIGIPMSAGYLLGTSTFDTTATYAPNMKLSATNDLVDETIGGVARPAAGTEATIGSVVIDDFQYSPYNAKQKLLIFQAHFTPAS